MTITAELTDLNHGKVLYGVIVSQARELLKACRGYRVVVKLTPEIVEIVQPWLESRGAGLSDGQQTGQITWQLGAQHFEIKVATPEGEIHPNVAVRLNGPYVPHAAPTPTAHAGDIVHCVVVDCLKAFLRDNDYAATRIHITPTMENCLAAHWREAFTSAGVRPFRDVRYMGLTCVFDSADFMLE